MEAGLRAVSLCLTMDLLWPFSEQEKPWIDRVTASLWQHLVSSRPIASLISITQ